MELFPPVIPVPEYLKLSRGYLEDNFTVYLPNGDTYDLDPSRMRVYLRLLGIEEEQVDRIVGYCWNFHSIYLDVSSGEYVWVPMEELRREVQSPIL